MRSTLEFTQSKSYGGYINVRNASYSITADISCGECLIVIHAFGSYNVTLSDIPTGAYNINIGDQHVYYSGYHREAMYMLKSLVSGTKLATATISGDPPVAMGITVFYN